MLDQPINVGNVLIAGRVFLAPMAGFTDLPFRKICRANGAAFAPGEMVASQESLRKTSKIAFRYMLEGDAYPKCIQLLGAKEEDLVGSAHFAISCGADIVDFNAGCPAKKVCSAECGAALLKEPEKLFHLLDALVRANSVPITLKMRIGWNEEHKNVIEIVKEVERIGVRMVTVHGRTAAQGFKGPVDYQTIKLVKESVQIPVVANGDIDSGLKACEVLSQTSADAVMIGRAALGNPWIFKEIRSAINGEEPPKISKEDTVKTIVKHVEEHLDFYGEKSGLRSIRKHLIWYFKRLNLQTSFVKENIQISNGREYLSRLSDYLDLKLNG